MVAAGEWFASPGLLKIRPMKQIKIASAFVIAALLISPRILTVAHGAELEKLNVFYSSIAATSVSTWIPKEAGIYQKYGLDVNTVYVSGAQAISTLISTLSTRTSVLCSEPSHHAS